MGKRFTKFLSTIMVTSMLGGLSSCVTSEPVESITPSNYDDWYSSGAQIIKIAEDLGADYERVLSLNPDKNNKPIRLAHNEGKPLEIAFHSSFEELVPYAIDSLDYLFEIIGNINDNYKYEVVDYVADNKHSITFKAGEEHDSYVGTASFSSKGAEDGVHNIDYSIIKIYKDNFKDSTKTPEEIEYNLRNTITHEIMHVLGFDDIYISKTNEHLGNTLINPISKSANKFAQIHLTPDDYNNLLALYAKPSNDLDADIERYRAMSQAYESEYYENWLISEFESNKHPLETLKKKETYTFSQKNITSEDSKEIDFVIDVSDNKYIFTVTDKAGNILERITGEVSYLTVNVALGDDEISYSNSVMLIENIESKYLYTNKFYKESIEEGAVSSLFLYKNKGKYILKDIFSFANSEVVPESELENQMQ